MARVLRVEADGGSRGNPGPAAYGALVRDVATGQVLAEVAAAIGVATNNVAEYRGLIAGLRAAVEIDADAEIEVALDSKLIVEQMSGRWKIRHAAMQELASEARSIVSTKHVRYGWVPRERNTDADRLVNAALDGTWDPQAAGQVGVTIGTRQRPDNHVVGWAPPATTAVTTLLLRHGETSHTTQKRFSGFGGDDPPLSPRGIEQATLAADFVSRHNHTSHIYTSPMQRALQTAHAAAEVLDVVPIIVDDLRECGFGEWEGHTFAEVQQRWPDELAAWLADTSVAPPSGESFDAVALRVERALDRITGEHSDEHSTVLLVSHVSPIKLLMRKALDAPMHALFRMELRPASLSSIVWFADGNASLRAFNDTSYLAGEPSPHTPNTG